MKTATVSPPCSFTFTYGAHRTIEYLTRFNILMPGDRGYPSSVPAQASHPPQAARNNNQDRRDAASLGPQTVDPTTKASNQVMDILHDYARHYAADIIYRGRRSGAILFPEAPCDPPVAGPSNVFHNQNPPAPTAAQPHPGGMGYHQRPAPVTGQPPDIGRPTNNDRTGAEDIDTLRPFSSALSSAPRPTTVGHPQQPDRYAGLPLSSPHLNHAPGFTATNAGSTAPSVEAGPDAGAAARAGWEGRRHRAAQDRGHSAGRADITTPRVGESRRRCATPLADSNALAASSSNTGDGVSVNRLVDGTGTAHAHQALTVTSTRGMPLLHNGLHRVNRSGDNIMATNSSNVANSARGTVTGVDSTHTAVPAITDTASNVPVPVTASSSAALASDGHDSDVGPADPESGSEGSGANNTAIADGVTQDASADEDAANVTKIDDQHSHDADEPVNGSGTNTAVLPVNKTAESGSDSGHSPPHKKHKVNKGDSGGTAGDDDA